MVESPNLFSLCRLGLQDHITDEMAVLLAGSKLLGQLSELNLRKCDLSPLAIGMLASSPGMAAMREWEIGCCEIDLDAARQIAASPHLRGLMMLSLNSTDITGYRMPIEPEVLRALLAGDWQNLQKLDLTQCEIGDEGARIIAQSPGLANVWELSLDNTGISEEGALAIAASPHLNRLASISIPTTDVSHQALLARIQKNYPGGEEDEDA